jgi:hypothetical protein
MRRVLSNSSSNCFGYGLFWSACVFRLRLRTPGQPRHAGSLPMLDRRGRRAYGCGKGFCNVQLFPSASWPALRGR